MRHVRKVLLYAHAHHEVSTAATCIWLALAAEAVVEKAGVEKGAAGCTKWHRGRQLSTPQSKVQSNRLEAANRQCAGSGCRHAWARTLAAEETVAVGLGAACKG